MSLPVTRPRKDRASRLTRYPIHRRREFAAVPSFSDLNHAPLRSGQPPENARPRCHDGPRVRRVACDRNVHILWRREPDRAPEPRGTHRGLSRNPTTAGPPASAAPGHDARTSRPTWRCPGRPLADDHDPYHATGRGSSGGSITGAGSEPWQTDRGTGGEGVAHAARTGRHARAAFAMTAMQISPFSP
jgi:hypothetical protein